MLGTLRLYLAAVPVLLMLRLLVLLARNIAQVAHGTATTTVAPARVIRPSALLAAAVPVLSTRHEVRVAPTRTSSLTPPRLPVSTDFMDEATTIAREFRSDYV